MKNILFTAIGLLLVGILPLNELYFLIMRIFIFGLFAYLIYQEMMQERRSISSGPLFYLALAVIYNPVFKFHFGPFFGGLINAATAGYLYYYYIRIIKPNEDLENPNKEQQKSDQEQNS